jgi:hypothetical protein
MSCSLGITTSSSVREKHGSFAVANFVGLSFAGGHGFCRRFADAAKLLCHGDNHD